MNKTSPDQKPDRSKSKKSKSSRSPHKSTPGSKKREKLKDDDGILVETARKIEIGAKMMGERASDVAEKVSDQTSEIADVVYDTVKKSVSDAYGVSSRTLDNMSKKALEYVNKYEHTVEMKKLSNARNIKLQELGTHIYGLHKSKSLDLKALLTNVQSQNLLSEVASLNKEIVKIGRKIRKKK